jgi:tetratricopeptide (TPR) repeat protein
MMKGAEMKDGGPTADGRLTLTILLLIGFVVSFLPSAVLGEVKTITHTVRQPFGGSQSPDDARIAVVARAKREGLEMAGTYVQTLTVVKDSRVEKDEILALTAGVLTAEVVSQENYHTKDAFGVEVIVRINVDASVLEDGVKKLLADRTHLEQLNQARKKEKELLDTVAKLQDENERLTAEKKSTKQLKQQFHKASQGLAAVEWFERAWALWQDGKFSDPKKAIKYLNEATRLKPDYAEVYTNRGATYLHLKDYPRAILDFDQALSLKPDDAAAYNNRGLAYWGLKDYERAAKDFDQALRLEPDFAAAYYSRGLAYWGLKDHSRAILDFDQALRLKPDDAAAYYSRGLAYWGLKDHSRAILDFDQALRLKPDYAAAYNNRGIAHLMLGNQVRGCGDVQKACELGECGAYEYAKQKGRCR